MLDASKTPRQLDESADAPAIELRRLGETWRLNRLARYDITARVLSRERYWVGWRGELSPLDLALGWGRLADPAVDELIEWSQAGRWYFFHWAASSAYRNEDIVEQSANVHLVPATRNVRRALISVERDQLIALSGWLVAISGRDGGAESSWQSSTSRTDTGNGSCELMYVERVVTRGLSYY